MNLSSRRGKVQVAIVGAGPYGLSIAAHLRARGVPYRIFGRPMQGWLERMPEGMLLKSEGFASNLYDPRGFLTLKHFCAEKQIPYADTGIPVSLETFCAYGLAFQERLVPEVERNEVAALDRSGDGFLLLLDEGEIVAARHVVLAVGVAPFGHVPAKLAALPAEFLSHSSCHHNLEPFRGRSVLVIGGGSSAIDLAALLHRTGVQVQLVARRSSLRFHNPPTGKPRSFWQEIRYPMTGMGPGLRARLYTDAPQLFRSLPQGVRLEIVRTFAPPEGGWFVKDQVMGRVPLLLGYSPEDVNVKNGKVHLRLRSSSGAEREIVADHIIAATGYKFDLRKLTFLSTRIRSTLKAVEQTPILSSNFQSSVPGLYFVGLAAANSFGPMMRFALGAGFTARRLTRSLTRRSLQDRGSSSIASVATS